MPDQEKYEDSYQKGELSCKLMYVAIYDIIYTILLTDFEGFFSIKSVLLLNTPSIPWYKVYNFLWKNPKYKVYGKIVEYFLHNLGVNLIRKDKILRFPYFSYIPTSITYMY
jgi:hypothetical protein